MGRLIRSAAWFLGTALVIYLVALFALCHIRPGGRPLVYRTGDYYQWKGGVAWAKFHEFDPTQRWDALVIGSSHAYRGYDPAAFAARGDRVFNLGSSAQTPMNGYYLLEQYADRAHTGLVIFDLYENTFDQDGMESTSELTQDVPSDAAAAGMALSLMDPRGINLFGVRMMTKDLPPLYQDSTYRSAGFAPRADTARADIHYDKGRPFHASAMQDRYFRRCIALCAERNVPLVLVTHPYPEQSDHVRHATFHAYVDSVRGPSGPPYWDFAYVQGLNNATHFVDHTHLNAAGARLFSEALADSLHAHGYLVSVAKPGP